MELRQLSLMRHASALDDEPDQDRALSERGVCEARAAGELLATTGVDLVLCSSARRARETWEALRCCLETLPRFELEPDLYLASALTIMDCVSCAPDDARHILVIGHNPGIQELAWDLARGSTVQARIGSGMRPASLVRFEVHAEEWHLMTPAVVHPAAIWSCEQRDPK